MSDEYKDEGPFVMSRYLNRQELYQAMSDHIDRLTQERDTLKARAEELEKALKNANELIATVVGEQPYWKRAKEVHQDVDQALSPKETT